MRTSTQMDESAAVGEQDPSPLRAAAQLVAADEPLPIAWSDVPTMGDE